MTSRKLSPWLVRSSVLAIGVSIIALGAASPGSSQSFDYTSYSTAAGYLDSVFNGNSTTTVVINGASPQVVVDWVPGENNIAADGSVIFQQSGTTATFRMSGGGDFAILNRIAASGNRAIRLDGFIQGLVGSSAQTTGGTVFFYSPGGIVIGSNARIDVGALGLTTASPQVTGTGFTGTFITNANGSQTVTYDPSAPGRSITIESGAEINALLDRSSYVSLFAPIITQNGTINVDGSAALVAAEAGTLTWNDNGLFDIQVTTGTSGTASGVAIDHGGSTGGTVSGATGGSDYHQVYLVAVPKNTAITTLISGGSSLGFDVANAAFPTADGVILTSGYNVSGFSPNGSAGGTGTSDIVVTNSNFTSRLNVYARGNAVIRAEAGGQTLLAGSTSIEGSLSAHVIATGADSLIDAASTLSIYARADGNDSAATVTGGEALLRSENGARIAIGQGVDLDATGSRAFTARGGRAVIDVTSGGTIDITDYLGIMSNGYGTEAQPFGSGEGGTAQLFVDGPGSTLTVGGGLSMSASGYGGNLFDGPVTSFPGGNGTGGTALIQVGAATGTATLGVGFDITMNANGEGAFGETGGSGNGTGGTATLSALGNGVVTGGGDVRVRAVGIAGEVYGSGAAAGIGKGGFASVDLSGTGARVDVTGDLEVNADGRYYGGFQIADGSGALEGGIAAISASAGTLSITGSTLVSASTDLERSESSYFIGGGNATGGQALISATGTGSIAFAALDFRADAAGGYASQDSAASSATGGTASLSAQDSGSITISSFARGSASAIGAEGSGLNGGNGTGGTVSFGKEGNGSIVANSSVDLIADGTGGATSGNAGVLSGGTGEGGTVSLYALGSGTLRIDGSLSATASGTGGDGANIGSETYVAGTGRGGDVSVGAGGNATLLVGSSTFVTAVGTGGSGQRTAGQQDNGQPYPIGNVAGGAGFGGSVNLGVSGTATLDIRPADASITVMANGAGGAAVGSVAAGGEATGGSALISGDGGSLFLVNPTVSASATGGIPQFSLGSGPGGRATGGDAGVYLANGTQATFTANFGPALDVNADAFGGSPTFARGGDAVAGAVSVQALSGSVLAIEGETRLSASSVGGTGGGVADGRRNLGTLPPSVWVNAAGGSITFADLLTAKAEATAGDIFSSVGSAGAAAYGGSISITSTTVANGESTIVARNLDLGATATGGRAGTESSGTLPGFVGGSATGGKVLVAGQGGNGRLQADTITALVSAQGGAGGDASVTGGAGGQANGGTVLIGTTEGIASAATTGGATFATLTLDATARGGAGGLGFSNAGASGAGGAAFGGQARFTAAGSTVNAGAVTLDVGAQGGDAGSSPNYSFPIGAGGDATVGLAEVIVTGRAGSAQGGAIEASTVTGGLTATGGLGSVAGGRYYSAGPVFAISDGSARLDSISFILDAVTPSPSVTPMAARLALRNATVSIADGFTLETPGTLSVHADRSTLNAASLSLSASDFVADSLGTPVSPGTMSATTISINSANNILLAANLASPSQIALTASGLISAYDLSSSGDIAIAANGSVTLRNLSASGLIDIDTPFALTLGRAVSAGSIQLDAGGAVVTDAMDAGDSVIVRSGGNVQINGAVTAGIVNPSATNGALYDVGIYGLGSVRTGDLQAAGRVGLISGSGPLDAGLIRSAGDVLLLSGGNVSATGIASTGNASRHVYIANSSMVSGLPTEAFDPAPIFASAPVAVNGTIAIGEAGISGGTVLFASSGSFTSGAMNARGRITGNSGSMTTGAVTASGGTISLSGGALSFGAMSSSGAVSLTGSGSVSTGAIASGSTIGVTAQGIATVGDLDAVQSVAISGGTGIVAGNVARATAVQMASGGNLSIGSATAASSIDLVAPGGLLSLSGSIAAPVINLTSNDIAIANGIRVDAGDAGLITLVSTNGLGTRIGDGTAGEGYLLDRAEFSTLNSGSVVIAGLDTESAVDMTIGDVNVTGPLAGSTIDDPQGSVTFFVRNPDTQNASGTIRVTGSLRARGFMPGNRIIFRAGVFEMDAETGLVELLGQGNALAGTIAFRTPQIRIAQGSILQRLAQDPNYAGRANDLNTPLATARPDGVLRSGQLNLGGAQSVLIQNTGTRTLPAGFLAGADPTSPNDMPPAGSPPLDFIVSGQIVTPDGRLLTGNAVRDYLLPDTLRSFFTADSGVNGCAVSASSCEVDAVEPPVQILQGDNLTPTRIPGFDQPGTPQSDETEEEKRLRELAEEEAKKAPIPPPAALINTRPLDPVTDLDEPVSGSGNPSLIGGGAAGMAIGKGNQ